MQDRECVEFLRWALPRLHHQRHEFAGHPQETTENSVDLAHGLGHRPRVDSRGLAMPLSSTTIAGPRSDPPGAIG